MNIFEICKQTMELLVQHGYDPVFSDDETTVTCEVDGVHFLIYDFDEEHYGYTCIFDCARELTKSDEDEIEKVFFDKRPAAFPHMHFLKKETVLSYVSLNESFTRDIIEKMITELQRKDGMVEYLKTNFMRAGGKN